MRNFQNLLNPSPKTSHQRSPWSRQKLVVANLKEILLIQSNNNRLVWFPKQMHQRRLQMSWLKNMRERSIRLRVSSRKRRRELQRRISSSMRSLETPSISKPIPLLHRKIYLVTWLLNSKGNPVIICIKASNNSLRINQQALLMPQAIPVIPRGRKPRPSRLNWCTIVSSSLIWLTSRARTISLVKTMQSYWSRSKTALMILPMLIML